MYLVRYKEFSSGAQKERVRRYLELSKDPWARVKNRLGGSVDELQERLDKNTRTGTTLAHRFHENNVKLNNNLKNHSTFGYSKKYLEKFGDITPIYEKINKGNSNIITPSGYKSGVGIVQDAKKLPGMKEKILNGLGKFAKKFKK